MVALDKNTQYDQRCFFLCLRYLGELIHPTAVQNTESKHSVNLLVELKYQTARVEKAASSGDHNCTKFRCFSMIITEGAWMSNEKNNKIIWFPFILNSLITLGLMKQYDAWYIV